MMNQEQREYTVTQIEKNMLESERLGKQSINSAFLLGLATIAAIGAFVPVFQTN